MVLLRLNFYNSTEEATLLTLAVLLKQSNTPHCFGLSCILVPVTLSFEEGENDNCFFHLAFRTEGRDRDKTMKITIAVPLVQTLVGTPEPTKSGTSSKIG